PRRSGCGVTGRDKALSPNWRCCQIPVSYLAVADSIMDHHTITMVVVLASYCSSSLSCCCSEEGYELRAQTWRIKQRPPTRAGLMADRQVSCYRRGSGRRTSAAGLSSRKPSRSRLSPVQARYFTSTTSSG